MQVITENGYVTSYAFVGSLTDGIEVPDPLDPEHFETHFSAYRVKDGVLAYDEKQNTEIERKALCEELRQRCQTECFSYVNRGQPWYTEIKFGRTVTWGKPLHFCKKYLQNQRLPIGSLFFRLSDFEN